MLKPSPVRLLSFLLVVSFPLCAQKFTPDEIARWQQRSGSVTITRDTWGVPHISGKTDADAVFGMLYAQCEDDFNRVERNYIIATARLAEVEGEPKLYNDLRVRLFMDTLKAMAYFGQSPEWMKQLCTAFADGVNYYLYKHPEVRPKLIRRFQPWMPLLFSEGSIGGDIETISLEDLKSFYGKDKTPVKQPGTGDGLEPEPKGSNGFAIAPSRTSGGNALLYINPHTTFYFRTEQHVMSEEGLNAYGAATWGQFFIYQGFNEHCGWMHTSSAADVIDEYFETVGKKENEIRYYYKGGFRAVSAERIELKFKKGEATEKRSFSLYRTHHGPIIGEREGKWISVKLMQEPLQALTQSFQRTKSKGLDDFKRTMTLRTNSSNNTVYADDQGNIAYWHGDFMPKRDAKFDWSKPVDGSSAATEWQGLHTVDEIVHIINPESGWIQNCNSTPFTASGRSSPDKNAFPSYMAPDDENPRGLHAVKVLENESAFTIDKLIAAGYDPYLPAFEKLLPSLLTGYDAEAELSDTLRKKYEAPVSMLRQWDLRFSAESVPTTLAIIWADQLRYDIRASIPAGTGQIGVIELLRKASYQQKVMALTRAMAELKRDFGKWEVPWGELNRFQRITENVEPAFDDEKTSYAVPFTSAFWGSLAAFGSRRYPNTKKLYGNVGNSFVAAVEFGKRVKAKSIVTGGSSGHKSSPHFNDQGPLYAHGTFKEVWFYKEDFMAHADRTYHPGE